MDFKEAVKIFSKRSAKAFIVGQDTNYLLTKDPKASDVLVVDSKVPHNDNVLYASYLGTTNLLHKKDAVE